MNNKTLSTSLLALAVLAGCAPSSVKNDTGTPGHGTHHPGEDHNDQNDHNDDDDNNDDDTQVDSGQEDNEDVVETVTYDFDASDSLLYVQVFKDTSALGSGWAHDHVVRAADFEGQVLYNTSDISACEVEFSLPVDSLIVDEADMRQLVGYGDALSSGDRSDIREHMLAEDQLNVNDYAQMSFASTSCELTSQDGVLVVNGGLTVRGRTANVSIQVPFSVAEDKFLAQATFDMEHADFGMEPYSAYGGFVRNDDPLTFNLDMVGHAN